MLNFAEQTGSGAVIVVWSFLTLQRVLFIVIVMQFEQWRELWRGAALVRTARSLPSAITTYAFSYGTNRTCTTVTLSTEILSAPPCVTSAGTKAYVSSRAPNAQSVRYR